MNEFERGRAVGHREAAQYAEKCAEAWGEVSATHADPVLAEIAEAQGSALKGGAVGILSLSALPSNLVVVSVDLVKRAAAVADTCSAEVRDELWAALAKETP